jgi:uncharacterized protein
MKDVVMIYNLLNHTLFAVTPDNYTTLTQKELATVQKENPTLFSAMCKLGIIIPNDFEELDYVKAMNREAIFDKNQYRLTINPTLECNFHCWYCYENHPIGRMSGETMNAVVNHVKQQIQENNIQSLILDWFGGEPLLYFDEVMYPVSKKIQKLLSKRIHFLGSTTTNGYLINPQRAEQFKEIGLTNFQITLDGDEETHNKIRFLKGKKGSFQTIINNINLLSEYEKNSIMVRINYTEETLKNINTIVNYFSEKAKEKINIHFQQVWQDSINQYLSADENKEYFKSIGYNVQPFELNTGYHVCYADKLNEAVINYDGRVFKCTARNFTIHPEDGLLLPTGEIDWKKSNHAKRFGNATFENPHCLNCNFVPVCMGPCSQKMVEFDENQNFQSYCLREGIKEVLEQHIAEHYQFIQNNLNN